MRNAGAVIWGGVTEWQYIPLVFVRSMEYNKSTNGGYGQIPKNPREQQNQHCHADGETRYIYVAVFSIYAFPRICGIEQRTTRKQVLKKPVCLRE